MRAAAVVAVLVTSGCGRIDFDGTSTDDAATPDAAGPASFDPTRSGCTQASAGPFVLAGSTPTQGGGYGVWVEPPFILRADTTGGLHSLAFDGTAFSQRGAVSGIGWVEAVTSGDGRTLFVGAPGTGLAVVELSSTGELTLLMQEANTVVEARRAWVTEPYVFVPAGGAGLHALRWDGSALTPVGTALTTIGWAQAVWAAGNRVLFADANAFRVLDFDGTTFTETVTRDSAHGGVSRVWHAEPTIFVANGDGATAYRIAGNSLVELDTFPTAGAARDIWADGQHVFVASEAGGVYGLRFANDRFTLVDQVGAGDTALGVFGDGTYVYANFAGGLRAYRGFECAAW